MPYTFRARFCPICGRGGRLITTIATSTAMTKFTCDNPEQFHQSWNPDKYEDYRVVTVLDASNVYQTFRENPAKPLGFLRRINRLRRQFGLPIWRELPSVEEWLHQSPFE